MISPLSAAWIFWNLDCFTIWIFHLSLFNRLPFLHQDFPLKPQLIVFSAVTAIMRQIFLLLWGCFSIANMKTIFLLLDDYGDQFSDYDDNFSDYYDQFADYDGQLFLLWWSIMMSLLSWVWWVSRLCWFVFMILQIMMLCFSYDDDFADQFFLWWWWWPCWFLSYIYIYDDFADYDDGAKALEKCWLHSWQRKPESEGGLPLILMMMMEAVMAMMTFMGMMGIITYDP